MSLQVGKGWGSAYDVNNLMQQINYLPMIC